MSTISNKLFVQIIEDGTTLHGELRATRSLTQSYKAGTCIPDWTNASYQPTIYLSLMNGADVIAPDSGYKWYYNGTEITASDTRFQITTYSLSGVSVPALKIVANLADSTNVDIDVITFEGQKTLATNPVPLKASINVTITEWIEGGYLGVIDFANGIADITRDNATVTATATLFDGDGDEVADATYKWYIEGSSTLLGTGKSITITESMVVDYAILRCEFYRVLAGQSTATLVFTKYAEVDDKQDPETMWVYYNGANSNTASLKDGQSVTFNIWVGKNDNTAVLASWASATYQIKVLNSKGVVVSDTVSGTSIFDHLPAADSNGYRTLSKNADNKAVAQITFNDVKLRCDKGLTGILIATV